MNRLQVTILKLLYLGLKTNESNDYWSAGKNTQYHYKNDIPDLVNILGCDTYWK